MLKRIDIPKLVKRLILLTVLLGIFGVIIADRMVKKYGYENIGDFVNNYRLNSALASQANPVDLKIDISKSDYAFLEAKRQEALDRGVQINIGDNYVPCEIEVDGGEKVFGEIRLKGHMTDHLEGKKWSFRVKSDEPVMGMYRFSLQHPGTRNYAYEWVYHQLLKQEEVIYLHYDFVQLQLRDDDLGVYALEEHFGQHILERNNRPKGAILRWNPNLYWEWRIDELDGDYLDEQYSAYTSSFPEPYDKGTVRRDSGLIQTYIKGAQQLEAFRRGEKKASEVFDIERMARFHAIIDLVGGYHSLDWSDVKFFYNSATELIEPVGYESFSVRKSERIAGQRIPDQYEGVADNYHDQLFADPEFFAAYIRNLERICSEQYFDSFRSSIQEELDQKLAILATEWPHRKFSFDPYYENIRLINHNIELPKPFHAFNEGKRDTSLVLSVAPVSDYPIELIDLKVDGEKYYSFENVVLPAKARNDFVKYLEIEIPYSDAIKFEKMEIKSRIPGASTTFKTEVYDFPSYKYNQKVTKNSDEALALSEHPSIRKSVNGDYYYFNQKDILIDRPYVLTGGELRLKPGQQFTFLKDGYLNLQHSQFSALGTKDHPVTIHSDQDGIFLFVDESTTQLSNCQLIGKGYGIEANSSHINIEASIIADFEAEFLSTSNCDIAIVSTDMGSVSSLGYFDRSYIRLKEVKAKFGQTFVNSHSSNFELYSTNIKGYEKAFDLDHISIAKMWNTNITATDCIGELDYNSELYTFGGDFGNARIGLKLDQEGEKKEASKYNLYKTNTNRVHQLIQ